MKLNTDAESDTEEVLPSHVIVGVENVPLPSIIPICLPTSL